MTENNNDNIGNSRPFLTPREIRIWKIYSALANYVPWSFPIQWDTTYSSVFASQSVTKYVPFCTNITLGFIIGTLNIFVVLFRGYLFTKLTLSDIVHFFLGSAIMFAVSASVHTMFTSSTALSGFNELLKLSSRLQRGKNYRALLFSSLSNWTLRGIF